jgi:DNA-directed RNA polymerase specialized sigma subunit
VAVGCFSAAGCLASESAWVNSRAYQDAKATLQELLASLPERDRQIVMMRYFEERDLEAIAKALNVSYISARRYHHAALQRLGARHATRGVDRSSLAGA